MLRGRKSVLYAVGECILRGNFAKGNNTLRGCVDATQHIGYIYKDFQGQGYRSMR